MYGQQCYRESEITLSPFFMANYVWKINNADEKCNSKSNILNSELKWGVDLIIQTKLQNIGRLIVCRSLFWMTNIVMLQ